MLTFRQLLRFFFCRHRWVYIQRDGKDIKECTKCGNWTVIQND